MLSSTTRPTSGARAIDLILAALLALATAAAATALDGWPAPRVFDEFSQILAGETFARGRLTNPPHTLPHFFETIHVLQQPTYSSKYFPGPGLALGAGILLTGSPRLGQWLAFASMAPALLWMLSAWMPRRGAILGTALTILLLADTPWASGYWGSSLTVTGGALMLGAFRRLVDDARVGPAVALGLGVTLLAYTRPFEGFVASIPFALFFAVWLFFPAEGRRGRLVRVGLPCTAVVAAAAGFLALHNHAVTGDPLRSAYSEYESRAPGAPPFVWQEPVPPSRPLRPAEAARLRIDMAAYQRLRSDWPWTMRTRLMRHTIPYYLPSAVFAALLLLVPFALRDRTLHLAGASVLAVAAATGISSYFLPHYIAPALPGLVLLYSAAAGVLTRVTIGSRPVGRFALTAWILALAGAAAYRTAYRDDEEREMADRVHWTRARYELAQQLRDRPGSHLVFVRYAPEYRSQNEWVQNEADLAGAKVLWAHDLGAEENRRLIAAESHRDRWLVTLSRSHRDGVRVGPYDPEPGRVALAASR